MQIAGQDADQPRPNNGDGQSDRRSSDNGDTSGNSDSQSSPPPWGNYPDKAKDAWLDNPPACKGSTQDWLAKYFEYRLRLRGNDTGQYPGFVDIGPDRGQSLPASGRRPSAKCKWDWYVNNAKCDVPTSGDARGVYVWGDGTINLGYYIAVLATEYKMFERLGVDTSQTVHDLYYALHAFNRLDKNAELYYDVPKQKDGFFLRHDVPPGFHKKDNGEYRFKRNDGYKGYECVTGVPEDCGPPGVDSGIFISQDQTAALTFGLAFVKKMLPKGLSYKNMRLRREARAIHHRIVTHLRSHDWWATDPDGETPSRDWGGSAVPMSNQLAKAANWIVDDKFGVDDYRDGKSKTQGATIFAGLGSSWSQQTSVNRAMASELVAVTQTWNMDKYSKRMAHESSPMYAYARAILHDTQVGDDIAHWKMESELTRAPCHGSCTNTQGCPEVNGWQGGKRSRSPENRFGYKYNPNGEHNGMDYMLMHNVYFLYRGASYRYPIQSSDSPDSCKGATDLQSILRNGPEDGLSYEPSNRCTRKDMNRTFCGRPWSSWIKAAYDGEATIWTGTKKWECKESKGCKLKEAGSKTTDGIDLFLGTGDADAVKLQGQSDCAYGFGGDDVIRGQQGLDEIHGGGGDDELYGENKGVVVSGGYDFLWGGSGDDLLSGRLGDDALVGGEGNDELQGDAGRDLMRANAGNDTLKGDAGADKMWANSGDDEIKADSGDDFAWAGPGVDKVKGDSGSDRLRGGPGNDFVKGDAGDDDLQGNKGANRVCGNGGDDKMWGGGGAEDSCRGGWGEDQVKACEREATYIECTTPAYNGWSG